MGYDRARDTDIDMEISVHLGYLARQLRLWATMSNRRNIDAYGVLIDFIKTLDVEIADEEFSQRLIKLARAIQKANNT